jgi:MFS-type transporter involved in bile tolerance (Atg22 family)
MAITTGVNNIFKQAVMLGEHDLNTNTIKVALVSSSQNVSAGHPAVYASIGAELANGNGFHKQ